MFGYIRDKENVLSYDQSNNILCHITVIKTALTWINLGQTITDPINRMIAIDQGA
jgi:hypothetical protein